MGSPLLSGTTVVGAIGSDLQAPTGAPLSDFGSIASLPQPSTTGIADADVIVIIVNNATMGWGCNNTDPMCGMPGSCACGTGVGCCDTIPVESASNTGRRTTGGCTAPTPDDGSSSCCPGNTTDPQAMAGKVCIYVSGGTNAVHVHGTSVLNGTGPTGASKNGFKLNWANAGDGETYIDAVWAYKAP